MSKRSARRKAARQRQAAQQAATQEGQTAASGNGQVSKSQPTAASANKAQQPTKASANKTQAGKSQPKHKVRGILLTIALALILVDSVLTAVLLLTYQKQGFDTTSAPWLLPAAGLVALLGVAAAVGLWFWKKWALVLYVATVLASIGLGLIVIPSLFVAFHALIPVLILGAALSVDKKLPLFE